MRLSLPILLLTTTAALAQSQPAPPDKPYVDDRVQLCPFEPPRPVTIGPGLSTATPRMPPPVVCQKPEPTKQPLKGAG